MNADRILDLARQFTEADVEDEHAAAECAENDADGVRWQDHRSPGEDAPHRQRADRHRARASLISEIIQATRSTDPDEGRTT